MTESSTPEWFVRLSAGPERGARLVVFPHAGGGPASVSGIAPFFDGVHVWSVNLPGRQARADEPPREDLDALVAELADALAAEPPAALFGYCSGALMAYLVACRLTDIGAPPLRLLVGSAAAPDIAQPPRRLHLLPSDAFWERLIDFGGIPDEVAAHDDLRPVLEPALRADFGLQAGYRHRPGQPLDVPLTVLYGAADTSLTSGELLGWRRHSTHRPTRHELASGHWLVDDAPAELAAAITGELH